MPADADPSLSTMAAQGIAIVKLVGDAPQLKLKAADGTLAFNEIFHAGAVPDPQVFTIYDDAGDFVTVASFTSIAKNFTIQYSGKRYFCQEAIPAQQQEQRQDQLSEEIISKLENSVCVLMERGKHFGYGFAVSDSHVYTAAHHWEEEGEEGATYFVVNVGDNVECIHGKPSSNKRYALQVVKIDKQLDYCILERTGDNSFPQWLETDVSPALKLTTPVFLAAYQIGIQDQLDHDYSINVSLGIATGAVVRRSGRHMVHSCPSFKGDSGGAIVIGNGKVIALHVAAVSEAKQLADLAEVDLGSVADSINQLCDSQYSGSVALLISAINP